MRPTKQQELEELRLEGKIKCLKCVLDALDADEWHDQAKGAKDLYASMVKDQIGERANRAVVLQTLARLDDTDAMRKLLEQDPQMGEVLSSRKALPSEVAA